MADRALTPDKLSNEQLAKRYNMAWSIIKSDSELMQLFKEATASYGTKTEMAPDEFAARLTSTQWYQTNNQYARKTLIAQAVGGADWATMQQTAKQAVKSEVGRLGLSGSITNEQLDALAIDYMMKGWADTGRAQLMTDAIQQAAGGAAGVKFAGTSGRTFDDLISVAQQNGLTYDQSYYQSAALSVNAGLTTLADQERKIRTEAASLYPMWSDKILAGQNAQDLASGYINLMAQTLEVDPSSITLNNPYLKQAFGKVDDKGNPVAMGLWDFQKMLRNDPRWMQTKQAQDEISNTARTILQTFGFMG